MTNCDRSAPSAEPPARAEPPASTEQLSPTPSRTRAPTLARTPARTNPAARVAALPAWRRKLHRWRHRVVHQAVRRLKRTSFGVWLVGRVRHIVSKMANRQPGSANSATSTGLPILGIIAPKFVTTDIRITPLTRLCERLGLLTPQRITARQLASGADQTEYAAILVHRNGVVPSDLPGLLRYLAKTDTRLVVELDDDMISAAGRARLTTKSAHTQAGLGALITLCQHADLVIVSTEPLAQEVRYISTAPVFVQPNLLDPDLWLTPSANFGGAPSPPPIRLLYYGTAQHGADLAVIKELPARLTATLGQNVIVELCGVTLGSLPPGFVSLFSTDFPYPDFVEFLRSQQGRWSVGLAPLVPDAINTSKSDIKLLEYAALGVPAVASRVGPYADADQLAVLVSNRPDCWVGAVERLLADPAFAQQRTQAAARYVHGTRMLSPLAAERWANLVLGVRQAAQKPFS